MKKIFKGFNYEKVPLPFRRLINTCLGFHFFYPYKKLKIIGITGTSGKTTTATLLYRIAMSLGYKAGLMGSVEDIIAGRKIVNNSSEDAEGFWGKIFFSTTSATHEVWKLKKLLSKMEDEGCEYVFMEVSSHGLEEKRVASLKFAGAIFTNLSHDHLDFHGNMENYFLAKKKFFKMLSRGAFALTNADDLYGFRILEGTSAHQFSYGFEGDFNKVHFHGEIKKLDFNGLDLAFNKIRIKSKLIGKFNAYNLLAAWSTCSLLGFDMDMVNQILENVGSAEGRFNHLMSPSGVLIIVDYAHKPDALENVLHTIKEIKAKDGRIISVFGCGGDRDSSKRPIMGKIGATLSDIAIFTSDNPRSEDPEKIIEQMKADLTKEELKKVITIINRHEAIAEAVKLAKSGDIILCAGKGHEDYQEIKGVKKHFNDLEEFKKIDNLSL